jgi:hypothetical protein
MSLFASKKAISRDAIGVECCKSESDFRALKASI